MCGGSILGDLHLPVRRTVNAGDLWGDAGKGRDGGDGLKKRKGSSWDFDVDCDDDDDDDFEADFEEFEDDYGDDDDVGFGHDDQGWYYCTNLHFSYQFFFTFSFTS